MAEQVQYYMEEMLQELEEMEVIGLFDNNETRKIIKRRRDLQYKLQRRMKTKEDYLSCIHYEVNLLKLVKKRREQRRLTDKKHDIDLSIAARINNLYKALINRHQSDISLWRSHLQFCEDMNWNDTASKLYSHMLQVHGDKPSLWIQAAKWEMTVNKAAETARNLMLQGLRFHPKCKELFLEYFRLELEYADRIRKRLLLLGSSDLEIDKKQMDAVIEGKIAHLIYKKAIEIMSDVEFQLAFLSICKEYDFTDEMQEDIFRDVQDQHATDEKMWNYLARQHLIESEGQLSMIMKDKKITEEDAIIESYKNCFEVFRTAVAVIPTEKMWTFYIQTCLDTVKNKHKIFHIPASVRLTHMNEAAEAMKEANSLNLLASVLYVEWVSILKNLGEPSDITDVLRSATNNYHMSAEFWKLRLENEIREGGTKLEIQEIFNDAFNTINEEDSLPIWLLGFEWTRITQMNKIENFFEKALLSAPNVIKVMKPLYLEFVVLEHGINEARNLYNRLRYQSPICEEFFYKMIKIEESQLIPNIDRLRNVFEDLVSYFGKSKIEPWLDYMALEKNHPKGQPLNVTKLDWRAVKMLDPDLEVQFTTAAAILKKSSSL